MIERASRATPALHRRFLVISPVDEPESNHIYPIIGTYYQFYCPRTDLQDRDKETEDVAEDGVFSIVFLDIGKVSEKAVENFPLIFGA
jgi:hypothetical protein